MIFDPAHLRSEPLRLAYAYWDRKRAGRVMPSRQDIDPVEMADWLPHVTLVNVADNPLEFRFRLVGTAVVARYGRDFTGERLGNLRFDGRMAEVVASYARSVADRAPQHVIEPHRLENGRAIHVERLLLPLSADGSSVNMLLGVQHDIRDGDDSLEAGGGGARQW